MRHALECFVVCDVMRTDGSPARLTLAVPCELEEVGPLPPAGEFVLSDGRRVRYAGHDAGAFLNLAASGDGATSVQSRLNEFLRRAKATPVPLPVDGSLHRVTRRPVTDRMLDGYVRATDPAARTPYVEDGAIDVTAAAMRAVVARHAVVSEGQVMVRTPTPVWQAVPARPGVLLRMPHDCRSEMNGMDEFAADRVDAAHAYCSAMRAEPQHRRLQLGGVEHLDPAYMGADDLVTVALRAGPFVASRLADDLQNLPPEMVARWHDAAQAASLQPGETWRAGEVLRSVADLIRYGEDPGNECGLQRDFDRYAGRRRWEAHRRRIFDIERIEPSPPVAGYPQGPTNA